MNKTPFSWKLFYQAPIVGIVRGLPESAIYNIAEAYVKAGLYTIEITLNTNNALSIISNLTKKYPNLNVGVGTVCNLKDLELSLITGAQFVVTPIIDEAVITTCVTQNIPVFPGAYTPTEIYKAYALGASAVKIFPATQLGAKYVKDVLAPLSKIKLLPTGGVSKDNITSFFEAGAIGVGMGSSLLNKAYLENEDYNGLTQHFMSIKNEITIYCKNDI